MAKPVSHHIQTHNSIALSTSGIKSVNLHHSVIGMIIR